MNKNTEQIAQTIANSAYKLAQVRTVRVDKTNIPEIEKADMLVIGCPTQRHKPTPAIQTFLKNIPHGILRELPVATFDTRYRMHRWKSGSAARVIAKKLRKLGGLLILPPESFFVRGREGPLEDGEIKRAESLAYTLLEKYKEVSQHE